MNFNIFFKHYDTQTTEMWPKVFRNHVFSRRIFNMALSQLQEVTGVVAKGCNVKLIFGKNVNLN